MYCVSLSENGAKGQQAAEYFQSYLVQFENDKNIAVINYPAGFRVKQQGFPVREVHFVQAGLLKVIKAHDDGQQFMVCIIKNDWILGVTSALLDIPFLATVSTISPAQICSMPREMFVEMIREDREFSWNVHHQQSLQIMNQKQRLTGLACMGAEKRLAAFLTWALTEFKPTKESETNTSCIPLRIPFKQLEIAQFIAVTPEHLNRLLREMEEKGVIQRHTDRICVLNESALTTGITQH